MGVFDLYHYRLRGVIGKLTTYKTTGWKHRALEEGKLEMLHRATKRQILVAAPLSTLLMQPHGACAEAAWPSRPVRVVVPFPPGQSMDVLPRFLGDVLARRLMQPFVFENRPGGVGVPAIEAVIHAAPDGYTLAVGSISTLAVNPVLLPRLPYDVVRDLVPVARLFDVAVVVVVHPSVPARILPNLITWLRANPGTRYASAGPATTPHLAGELLSRRLGLTLEHVSYRGSAPAMADVIAGVVPLMFDTATSALPHVRSGRVRLLAVTSATRLPRFPDTPTVAEAVSADFEAIAWGGFVAPAGTPRQRVEAINAEIQVALADPGLIDRFAELGAVPTPTTSADFSAFVRAEGLKWGELVRAAGIRIDG